MSASTPSNGARQGYEGEELLSFAGSTPLPEIPPPDVDSTLSLDFSSVGADDADAKEREVSVQKLAEEKEKLEAELKALDERLQAAERKKQQLEGKQRS